jgi:hypothetical protein
MSQENVSASSTQLVRGETLALPAVAGFADKP